MSSRLVLDAVWRARVVEHGEVQIELQRVAAQVNTTIKEQNSKIRKNDKQTNWCQSDQTQAPSTKAHKNRKRRRDDQSFHYPRGESVGAERED